MQNGPPSGQVGAGDAGVPRVSVGMQPRAPTTPPQPPASDAVKTRLIQEQLVLLLHARKCQNRDRAAQANGENWQCSLPQCNTIKGVLNHVMTCQVWRTCPFPHCSSSKQIINHWKLCNKNDCHICVPIKQLTRSRNTNGWEPRSSGRPNPRYLRRLSGRPRPISGRRSPSWRQSSPAA